jgi:hypothetical protein
MKLLSILFLSLCTVMLSSAQVLSYENQRDTVTVGVYLISVHDINFHNKEYTARFWLWFLYDNPMFNFRDQLDIPNAKAIDPPEIFPDTINGKPWIMLKMKCTMKEKWSVQDFPFDHQSLHIQIENSLYDNKLLVFRPDVKGSNYDSLMTIDGWKITDFTIRADSSVYPTAFGDYRIKKQNSVFSSFNINMEIERDSWGLFTKIFIGMYISFLIAMVSFAPKPTEIEPRFGLPVGGLFAAVGNKYIIDPLLPESSTFTLVDTLHTITFLAIFAMLMVSAFALKFHDWGRPEMGDRVDKVGATMVVVVYVVVNVVFVGVAYS